MHSLVGPRLSIMMFIQFFIWGAWYVTAPRVLSSLGFAGPDIGWTYTVGPIAGMISPFFVGMFADRFFSTERVLAVMHFGAGAAMFGAIALMGADNPSPDLINLLFFVHMLCYFPTLALTNSLAMHNMTDSEKQFPMVRVFGTIGWICAGIALNRFGWGTTIEMFYLAGGAALVMGIYSLTLPHTPPPNAKQQYSVREALGLDALILLRRPSFLAFMFSSLLICIPLAFYYQMAERALGAGGISDPEFKMTFGQMSEIIFMVLMPFFFKRLGVKWMLLVGMLAWTIRYALFAIGAPDSIAWMLISGVLLHGICYDFFFVTGQIYTDKVAPPAIRGQAQGMLVLFTLGLGMAIGAQVGGRVEAAFTPAEAKQLNDKVGSLGSEIKALEERLVQIDSDAEKEQVQKQVDELKAKKVDVSIQALKAIDWRPIWTIPAVGAAVIMLLFAIVFKDDTKTDPLTEGEVPEAAATEEMP